MRTICSYSFSNPMEIPFPFSRVTTSSFTQLEMCKNRLAVVIGRESFFARAVTTVCGCLYYSKQLSLSLVLEIYCFSVDVMVKERTFGITVAFGNERDVPAATTSAAVTRP